MDIASSSTGEHEMTLCRETLQAHLMHGDFYMKGRTPVFHRSSERTGQHSAVLILTFRHCSLSDAAKTMREMGFQVTTA